MCGIAGMVGPGAGTRQDVLRSMCRQMVHRGPDDEGFFLGDGVALGMRRLSVIDLQTGHQPIGNEDGSVRVVLNGEIYNYRSLATELRQAGHSFATRSDTETVVHAYEEYGEDFVTHLAGMFAIALWDTGQEKLVLARDRVGKKPLNYAIVDGELVFASEFAALLQHPSIGRRVDLRALHYYLSLGYVPAPMSAYEGVVKLPPANLLAWQAGQVSVRPYWRVDFGRKVERREEDAVGELRGLLRDAVGQRMIADVPLGAFLSGGLDSSSVLATMCELSDRPVKTFHVAFGERDYGEQRYARLVAKAFGTEHHELQVEPRALEVLPTLVRRFGEPFADSSAVPTFYLSKLAREHVTVALNGDGGDELFAGYDRHRAALWSARVPGVVRNAAGWAGGIVGATFPGATNPKMPVARAARFLRALPLPDESRYLRWVGVFGETLLERLYEPSVWSEVGGFSATSVLFPERDGEAAHGWLDRVLLADTRSYLPNDLLAKVDIASMANSLEARSPLLDHRLLEWAAQLPPSLKLRGFQGKYVLRQCMRKVLPDAILERRKMGFGVPVGVWFRGELRDFLRDTLLSDRSLKRGYFRPDVVQEIVDRHLSGSEDHTHRLWALLMLELWHQQFIDTTP